MCSCFCLFSITLQSKDTIMDNDYAYSKLFHVDSRNIRQFEHIVRSGWNGFLLCKQGFITLFMDGNRYDIRTGNLYIYPAFSETRICEFSPDFKAITGIADFNSVLSSLHPVSDSQSYIYMRFHPLVSLDEKAIFRIEELFELIARRENTPLELKAPIIASLQQALCYEIVGAYMAKRLIQSGRQSRKDKIFQSFLVDLHQHFRQHRDVTFYAELQYITPRHFATQIHDKSGKTPLQWIALFTVSESKRLLDNPKMSIKEIAEMLNFPEQASFGRYFKQHTGTSPTEYRLLCQIR